MKTNGTLLRFGETLRNIIADEYSNKIVDNLKSYLRSSDYYGAWNRLIDNTDYYYRLLKNRISHLSSDSSDKNILVLVLAIVIPIIVVSLIVICYCACYRFEKKQRIQSDRNFLIVGKFLKENRNNQAIFTDYCSLCLEKLRNEPFQEIMTENTENGIIVSPEGIKTSSK